MSQEKEYTGSFTLGAITPTYDLESEPVNYKDISLITKERIMNVANQFTGEIMQVPPAHSAIKIDGKRVYELARQGKEVKIEPRRIVIKEFEITKIEMPVVFFRVVCTTGTYIRSLANDFGDALGCGAYLSSLCRTRIGDSTLDNAKTMAEWENEIKNIRMQMDS
jgi:tRNA pseudouridine55 synthase